MFLSDGAYRFIVSFITYTFWIGYQKTARKYSQPFSSGSCYVEGRYKKIVIFNQYQAFSETIQDMAVVTMEDE